MRCKVGMTGGLEVRAGLHQGSVLSPFLFASAVDRLTERELLGLPFIADHTLYRESKEQIEMNLESWR